MPFATLDAVPVSRRKPPKQKKTKQVTPPPEMPKVVPPPPPPTAPSVISLNIQIIAPTVAQAEDLLCGLYFEAGNILTPHGISTFAKDYQTQNLLVALKRSLEYACRAPVGNKTVRRESSGLTTAEISMGVAAEQAGTAVLRFHCGTPGTGCCGDTIWAVVNAQDPQQAQRFVAAVRGVAGNRPVLWILTGGEAIAPVYEASVPFGPAVSLQQLGSTLDGLFQPSDQAIWVQVYGGLIPEQSGDGITVMVTHSKCREYEFHGCVLPLLMLLQERKNSGTLGEGKVSMERLIQGFGAWATSLNSWQFYV